MKARSRRFARKLPYTEGAARAYGAFDLPFSAPLSEVTNRFLQYLDVCRPGLFRREPEKMATAIELTKRFIKFHEIIREAWEQYGFEPEPDESGVLPYSEKAARAYSALDLPYSAPMEKVTKQYRNYLKKCHPDLHQNDPNMLKDANKLTRILTEAHETIRRMWENYDG